MSASPTRATRPGVSVCPLGVAVDYIESRARTPETEQRVKDIWRDLGRTKLILSVGRTDYTKGGAQQLESFERILETQPDLRGKLRLMHVSVAANRNMSSYEDIQTEIEQIAGRINGRFGTLEWQPVALISRAIPFDELVAYYRAADVAWITPLADGMKPRVQGIRGRPRGLRRGSGAVGIRRSRGGTGRCGHRQPVFLQGDGPRDPQGDRDGWPRTPPPDGAPARRGARQRSRQMGAGPAGRCAGAQARSLTGRGRATRNRLAARACQP